MKNIKYVTFIIVLMFINNNVFATCSNSEIDKLTNIANSIKITYQYNSEYEKLEIPVYGSFNIYITGVTNDVYIYDYALLTNYYYAAVKDGVIAINNVGGGDRYIYVYSNLKNCPSKLIKKIFVDVPKFNFYAVSNYCDGIDGKDFVYCDKWYQLDVKKSVFLTELEIYKNKKNNVIPDDPNKNEEKNNNVFINFLNKYYVYLIAGVFLLIILSVYLIIRRKRGNIR